MEKEKSSTYAQRYHWTEKLNANVTQSGVVTPKQHTKSANAEDLSSSQISAQNEAENNPTKVCGEDKIEIASSEEQPEFSTMSYDEQRKIEGGEIEETADSAEIRRLNEQLNQEAYDKEEERLNRKEEQVFVKKAQLLQHEKDLIREAEAELAKELQEFDTESDVSKHDDANAFDELANEFTNEIARDFFYDQMQSVEATLQKATDEGENLFVSKERQLRDQIWGSKIRGKQGILSKLRKPAKKPGTFPN